MSIYIRDSELRRKLSVLAHLRDEQKQTADLLDLARPVFKSPPWESRG